MLENRLILALLLLFCCLTGPIQAQVGYTAKTQIGTTDGYFRVGCNQGYNPNYSDEDKAFLLAGNGSTLKGVGARTLRPALPDHFLEQYGYDIRVGTFQFYPTVGLDALAVFVGYPSAAHRDTTQFCQGIASELFANMYLPIWDGGLNGTPYNDDNYYAAYMYKMIQLYGNNIKYYEIWNEPAFDYTGACGWQPPGTPCNWWDNNPDPCHVAIHASVMQYVRMLRISWDVIKTLKPDAFVTLSGIGYDSYLDAILRNTDNPVDGSVTAEYPHGGGAYFDCIGYHSYPHIDGSMRAWSNAISNFVYYRHSDRAAEGVITAKTNSQAVLSNYGYNGTTYPLKKWIITECNIPRKEFGDFIGSAEAQRNFVIKSVVMAMQNGIDQIDWYSAAENATFTAATNEFDVMGMYKKFSGPTLTSQVVNDEGKASKTVSDMLFLKTFDVAKTAAMNLPSNVGGGAFKTAAGDYTYVLWAKTATDKSEVASATYSFPATFNLGTLNSYAWNFSYTNAITTSSWTNIALTGSPKFFRPQAGCAVLQTYFADADNDGFGNPAQTLQACSQPTGYASNCIDCNDAAVAINVNAIEVADNVDNNCNGTVDDVCGNIPSMGKINRTATSVLIYWPDMPGADQYELQLRKVGTTTWGAAQVAIPSYKLLIGLTAATNYELRYRTKCHGVYTSYATTLFTFSTPLATGTCSMPPTLGTAEPVSNSSVILVWNFNYAATKYQARYKAVGTTTWKLIGTTSVAQKTLVALTPGVTYEYNMRAYCPSTNWTAWSTAGSFTMPVSVPQSCNNQLVIAPNGENQSTENTSDFSVFTLQPNPTSGYFKAIFDETQVSSVQVSDAAGKIYLTWLTPASDQLFDISSLPDGFYLVTLINQDGSTQTSRLVKTGL
jgi:Putative metal-binding motif